MGGSVLSSNLEWKTCKWGDISTLEYGKALRDYKENKVGYPVFGTNGLIGHTDKYLSDQPGVIVGRKGAYRGVHYSKRPFYVIDTAYFLKPKINQLDLKWAYYNLRNKDINNLDSGSAIPSTSRSDFYSLDVELPELNEQQEIANLLTILDDKIEHNNAINKNLEEMAHALFKRWFVDFEFPNENGEPYKSSGGEFEESVLGMIPKEWAVEKLGDCTKLVSRGIAPKYEDNSEKRVINQKCIRDGLLNKALARTHNTKVSDEKQVLFGDILVNSTGVGTLGRVTQVYEQLSNYTVDSHVTIIRPNIRNGLGYMGCLLKRMQQNFEHAATGSTGQTELGREVIKQMNILMPVNNIVEKFTDIYHSFFEKIIMNQRNNTDLAHIRDSLLPKLISGEIRVPIEREYVQITDLPMAVKSKEQYPTT